MSPSTKHVGTYEQEEEVLEKLRDLKGQGYKESEVFVMTKNKEDISLVRGTTDTVVQTKEEESWKDKFKHFLVGDDPIRDTLQDMGYDDQQAAVFYDQADSGSLVLFVDQSIPELEERNS
ncbi:general stress protein [Virgibacillus xinjiangensis]|uniref:General stress protein n=1 Tax=Virgibacillus xinjiangensis TaxID=393090 RepID=A0ABV7CTE9_9BACI